MKHGPKHYSLVALQIVVAVLLFALFLSLYKYTETLLVDECKEKASRDLERIQLTIRREMQQVETATEAFAMLEFGNGTDIPNDSAHIFRSLERFIQAMPPSITGAIIGFEDGVLPRYEAKYGFIPLVRYVDNEYIRYQLGGVRDIRAIHDWYRETKRLDHKRWAEPQLAEEGEVICGYCFPLHDAAGKFIGVLEVDFSLDLLSKEVCNIRTFPTAEPMVISGDDDFTILMCPQEGVALKETMQTLLEKRGGLRIEDDILKSVHKGENRSHHIRQGTFNDVHEVFFHHMRDPYTGWTIQMTCPASEVTVALLSLRIRMTVIAITILALMFIVALTYMRRF